MNEYEAAFKAGEAWARAGGDEHGLDAASREYMAGKDDSFVMGWVFAASALHVMNEGGEFQ